MSLQDYKSALLDLRNHLAAYGDRGWVAKLDEWITEFDGIIAQCDLRRGLVAHAIRTKLATEGRDSLADLYLCEAAGHTVPEQDAIAVNERHLKLVDALYAQAQQVIARFG